VSGRVVLAGLLATALSCGSGRLVNSGTGGVSAGTGGSIGGTGGGSIGGTGGDGGGATGGGGTGGVPLPACGGSGSSNPIEVQLVGSDGTLVAAPVTVNAVNVAGIDSCEYVTCPSGISTIAKRISLTAAGPQSWTLYLRNDAMPIDVIRLGDTFDLTVDASTDSTLYRTVNQTVGLSRGGNLIAFAASLAQFFRPRLPPLGAFGVTIADDGAVCATAGSPGCTGRAHAARVTVGTDSAVVNAGQNVNVGWLSFTNSGFLENADTGACDSKSTTVMAGFRTLGLAGRVQVTQQEAGSDPRASTQAFFGLFKPCTGASGVASCTCVESSTSTCVTRSCSGYLNHPVLDDLLGYRSVLAEALSAVALDAGDLRVRNGSTQLDAQLPYDVTASLGAPWLPADAIEIAAAGASVPAFSTTLPFPPRVTFLEPDLGAASIALPDTLALRWTPVQGTGTVEATATSYSSPDAQTFFTIVRCSAPVSAGELMVPIPQRRVLNPGDGDRGLAVRVVNTTHVATSNLTVDVRVASFDSGRINEALPPPDGGADAN
jgi:hypothetical protein